MTTRWLAGVFGAALLACEGTTGETVAMTKGDGGDPSGDPSGDPPGEPGGVCDPEVHEGEATYYAADGSGNCSFPADPGDPRVAAMNDADYAQSAACGACVAVDGPDGTITVRIVDRCPGCPRGDIDLSEGAFPQIAAKELGRVPISWRYVSCPVTGALSYHFKDGSSEYWTAVQVRGHRNPVARFEVRAGDGTWKEVARVDYNYFVDEGGMGPGPYAFRVTDSEGHVVEDEGVPLVVDGEAPGSGQFPACQG
jgi:expansin (peptidoglycan-binding protein)